MRTTNLFDADGKEIEIGKRYICPSKEIITIEFSEVTLGRDDWDLGYRALCINGAWSDGSGHIAILSDKSGSYGLLASQLKRIEDENN